SPSGQEQVFRPIWRMIEQVQADERPDVAFTDQPARVATLCDDGPARRAAFSDRRCQMAIARPAAVTPG
ncbi:hypothetical protein, partial [Pseudomonas sp. EL_65y_Pfl2_R96]|uniref:hypothetical protein n=1 Tax=Pseudomonas sp. EL_65y_Pfl2_R96 TaxID=3088699 RepID=UPI0030DA82E0